MKSLVEVNGLIKFFPVLKGQLLWKKQVGVIRACDELSFSICEAKTMGLVGESGCGKTTTGRVMLYLTPPTSGEFCFDGENVFEIFRGKDRKKQQALRRRMQMIFQNPNTSVNPRQTFYSIVDEPLKVHTNMSKDERLERIHSILRLVNLEDYHLLRYPHEFSGGERQRICIARALILEPRFLVADEPVASLDISIRAQILNLLLDLQVKLKLTYLYISHDLSSVRYISHAVAVMYLGRIVEYGYSEDIFVSPLHPYTRALISAIPVADPTSKRSRIILPGDVPSPINPPSGCRFHTRCPNAIAVCKEKEPQVQEIGRGHWVACHLC